MSWSERKKRRRPARIDPPRAYALGVRSTILASALVTGCASAHIRFVADVEAADPLGPGTTRLMTTVRGELSTGRIYEAASVEVDRTFETLGFSATRPPLRVVPGDQIVLGISDDGDDPATHFYIALPSDHLATGRTVAEGDMIPYLDLRLPLAVKSGTASFAAVCKGGRGRVTFDSVAEDQVRGTLAIRVDCRTYIDGHEREEAELRLEGRFRLERITFDPSAEAL